MLSCLFLTDKTQVHTAQNPSLRQSHSLSPLSEVIRSATGPLTATHTRTHVHLTVDLFWETHVTVRLNDQFNWSLSVWWCTRSSATCVMWGCTVYLPWSLLTLGQGQTITQVLRLQAKQKKTQTKKNPTPQSIFSLWLSELCLHCWFKQTNPVATVTGWWLFSVLIIQ